MECRYCNENNILVLKEGEFTTGYFCNECGRGGIDYTYGKHCCNYSDHKQVQFEQSNNVWVQRTACSICKTLIGGAVKKQENFNQLPKYTQQRLLEIRAQKDSECKKLFDYIEKLVTDYREVHNELWWKNYDEYLLTNKWQNIRSLVLERDNYICQGCLNSKAKDVHHTTYANLFDELLFQLIPLCRSCHQKLHPEKDLSHD